MKVAWGEVAPGDMIVIKHPERATLVIYLILTTSFEETSFAWFETEKKGKLLTAPKKHIVRGHFPFSHVDDPERIVAWYKRSAC